MERGLRIEDDFETVELIVEELVNRGYETAVACDGHEGFLCDLEGAARFRSMRYQPAHDVEIQSLERLNEISPKLGATPLVFLTALSDRENELRGRL